MGAAGIVADIRTSRPRRAAAPAAAEAIRWPSPTSSSVGSSCAVSGSGPARGRRRSTGPMNVGHEGLACASSTVSGATLCAPCETFCAPVCWPTLPCWCAVWACGTVCGCWSVTIYVRVRSRGCAAPRVAPTRAPALLSTDQDDLWRKQPVQHAPSVRPSLARRLARGCTKTKTIYSESSLYRFISAPRC